MGSVFKRGDSRFWWIGFTDATGKRRNISTESDDHDVAKAFLRKIEERVQAEKRLGLTAGPLTVKRYAEETWLPAREARGVLTVYKDRSDLAHAFPLIGSRRVEDVTRQDILAMVRALEAKRSPTGKAMAPRSIRHVYSAVRMLFADAMSDGLLQASPCTLRAKRGELPRKKDKDLRWRGTAVFSRGELEQLISDERIPQYRRVLWALLFLTGMRIGEAVARRWRDLDPEAEPLGRLVVDSHYDMREWVERPGTKTGPARDVPIHPTLAPILAAWKLDGWATHRRGKEESGDLIVPSPRGGFLHQASTLRMLHKDLGILGLRVRRQHDSRRTFVSLARGDGANGELLKWVTHGPPNEEVIDLYTTPPWPSLCAEVAKLRVQVRAGKVLRLPKVATASLRSGQASGTWQENHGRGGTRTLAQAPSQASEAASVHRDSAVSKDGRSGSEPQTPNDRSNVVTGGERGGES